MNSLLVHCTRMKVEELSRGKSILCSNRYLSDSKNNSFSANTEGPQQAYLKWPSRISKCANQIT